MYVACLAARVLSSAVETGDVAFAHLDMTHIELRPFDIPSQQPILKKSN